MVSKATNISKEEVSTVSRRKSMFSRLRFRKRNKKAANEDVREGSVDPVVNEPKRVEAPPTRSSKIPMQVDTPPEAEAAAFQGTPRYDWMDIVRANRRWAFGGNVDSMYSRMLYFTKFE